MENKKILFTKCDGEGQGTCKNCGSTSWMCFLYKFVDDEYKISHPNIYCRNCIKQITNDNCEYYTKYLSLTENGRLISKEIKGILSDDEKFVYSDNDKIIMRW